MSELREWLDHCVLAEELVTVKGRQFLVVELDMAARSRLFADNADGGELTNAKIEGLVLSRCVLDPATREQVVPTDQWQYWATKGCSFSALLVAAFRLNNLSHNAVDDEVKS